MEKMNELPSFRDEDLAELWRSIKNTTECFMLIHRGKIIMEEYAPGWNRSRKHYTASAAKALIAGLGLMLALDDNLLDLDDPACRYIPEWKSDPMKSLITIRHLASHTSGLEDAEADGLPHDKLTGWKGEFWKRKENPFLISRDQSPVMYVPGTGENYSNPGIAMLGYVLAAVLAEGPYGDLRSMLLERIVKPLGIPESEWEIGYNMVFEHKNLRFIAGWGGGELSANCLYLIGSMLLQNGSWNNQQLITHKTIQTVLYHCGFPGIYGAAWRINQTMNGSRPWPSLPADAYLACGAGNQLMLVIPSRDVLLVRFGSLFNPNMETDPAYEQCLFDPFGKILPPLVIAGKSEYIKEIVWAPASSVIRHADGGIKRDGSDNWPITWGGKDILYTAYGDGHGFHPSLPHKLGMGFARIQGTPECFKAENFRSDAENHLMGPNGEKACGLLMLNETLYMWVRNSDRRGNGSRLAWSKNEGLHFSWCDWSFPELGHVAVVQYGMNYKDARDSFVYMISHNNPSAYKNADYFVLLRAPKDSLLDRSSYEFYSGMNGNNPVWDKDFDKRVSVLDCPGHARRVSVSYNKGIGRYLLWQQHQLSPYHEDTRFLGGFGVYEAPEPWGPWKNAFFTDSWDIGPGDLGCFPTKWMSEDGRTVSLVFAGNDFFSLRRATIVLG